ncbi:MAG: DUF4296 domain-containing protein [Lentimicrobiaceae bacterium]|nr:DUF4296 domain-containing protein [Lentimicrobiaceae bacterium]
MIEGRVFRSVYNVAGVFLLLFVMLCVSCENEKTKMAKPKDLLEQKAFEAVLWEVYMTEGDVRFRIRNENFDSLRLQITASMNEMYQKNGTDHQQFISSYTYYMNDPDLSVEIMKSIVNQLVELQAKEEAKQKEKDSIAAASRLIENKITTAH